MASPELIYRIYHALHAHAAEVRAFEESRGEKVSGTLTLLCDGDPARPLARWGEEMQELCGVLDGTHDDSYLMESTQVFYWGSLYGALRGATWESLAFEAQRAKAATAIASVGELRSAAERLVALGPGAAPPDKLFMLWNAADWIYRRSVPAEQQWSIDQLMAADLAEMRKRSYLLPIIAMVQRDLTSRRARG